MAHDASPRDCGNPAEDAYVGAFPRTKMLGVGSAPRVAPLSPLQLDDQQIDALWQAAKNRSPFRCEVGAKGLEHSGFRPTFGLKPRSPKAD